MSNRNLPENFGRGLTLDGDRIEKNIRQAERLTVDGVPEHIVKQRMMPSWLVWGLMSDTKATPQPGPWMRETNTNDVSPTYTPMPTIRNPYRHKGVATPGIDLTTSNYLTWEVTWASSTPIRVNKFVAWLAVDSEYPNDLVYLAPTPPTKVNLDPLDDMSVALWVSDLMDPEDRTRTSIEAGAFKWRFDKFKLYYDPAFIPVDTGNPPHPEGAMKGVCIEVDCQVDLPAGRYGLSVTIPQYDIANYHTGWWDYSWARQVWSIGVQVQEGR